MRKMFSKNQIKEIVNQGIQSGEIEAKLNSGNFLYIIHALSLRGVHDYYLCGFAFVSSVDINENIEEEFVSAINEINNVRVCAENDSSQTVIALLRTQGDNLYFDEVVNIDVFEAMKIDLNTNKVSYLEI